MHDLALTHEIARLTLQIGVLLVAAHAAGATVRRIGLPPLIGEMGAGVLLGPYALGTLPLPSFPEGLFPLADAAFPISHTLFGFAMIGAIVHVFLAGIESDPRFLSRVRLRGVGVALLGAAGGLAAGAICAPILLGVPTDDRAILFVMAVSVSTSIGVQARILADQHRMSEAEGSIVLGASLFHDGIAILLASTAVLVGAGSPLGPRAIEGAIPTVAIAVTVWAVSYALLLLALPVLVRSLTRIMSTGSIAVITLSLALLLSGVFEAVGIASVAGAYGVGLALSRSDLSATFEQRIRPIAGFFIPVLYAVLGTLIDPTVLVSLPVLLAGIGLAIVSGLAKTAGAAIAARAGGFSWFGGVLVGVGTLPRGEVGLIIAVVGVAAGILTSEWLKVLMVMIVVSTLFASPLLSRMLQSPRPTVRRRKYRLQTVVRSITTPNEDLAELVTGALLRAMAQDGFFVHRLDLDGAVYSVRKDRRAFTLRRKDAEIQLAGAEAEEAFMNTALYEALVHVNERIRTLTRVEVPPELLRDTPAPAATSGIRLTDYIRAETTVVPLHARGREEAIIELVDLLDSRGALGDRDLVLTDILERERSMSTGLDQGVALPHAKSEGVSRIVCAVGLAPGGVDFQSMDGEPARIIILIASPKESKGPHLQLLAALVARLRLEEVRDRALTARDASELAAALTG